jgi:ketosteroid isomerase-like protein
MTDQPARQHGPDELRRVAERLYQAFAAHDGKVLRALLAPGFRGVVAEGMPRGLAGVYEGPEAMLRNCWGPVFALVDVTPEPAEYLPVAADRMVVLGRYTGTARGTGKPLSAAFAHVLRVSGGRVTEMVQYTDTARWREALGTGNADG